MNILINVLINIGFGLIGILLYTLLKARKYIYQTTFKEYLKDNMKNMIHSFLFICMIAVLIEYIPEINNEINDLLGFSIIENNKKSFIIFGITLSLFYN
nr:MAG TPA: hypothetical protein [Caudoviricetes sp.]